MTTEATTTSTEAAPATPSTTDVTGGGSVDTLTQTHDTTTQQTQTQTQTQEEEWFPAKYKDADGKHDYKKLANAYKSLEKKLGAKPNIPASDPEEYQYDWKGYEVNQEQYDSFKQEALKNGFTKSQFEFMMENYVKSIDPMMVTADKSAAVLQKEWGDEFKPNITSAKRAFQEYAPSDLDPNDPALNHPSVLKLLAAIGRDLGEDSAPAKASSAVGMSQEDIDSIMSKRGWNNDPKLAAQVDSWFKRNHQHYK